jgi:hypothetical protein
MSIIYWSLAEAKDFSSGLCVQTNSEAHLASYTMGTGAPFSGDKERPERDDDHSPYLTPRSRMGRYNTLPLGACMAQRDNFTFPDSALPSKSKMRNYLATYMLVTSGVFIRHRI